MGNTARSGGAALYDNGTESPGVDLRKTMAVARN
jgi:hypothetical protein